MIEQRKARRFELKLPFELVRSGTARTSLAGETVNISSVGAVLATDAPLPQGESVEYLITIPTLPEAGRVRIRCLGKIVRTGPSYIAVTLERYEFLRDGAKGAKG